MAEQDRNDDDDNVSNYSEESGASFHSAVMEDIDCRNQCWDFITLRPLREAAAGSLIIWAVYVVLLVVAFFLFLFITIKGDAPSTAPLICLILSMGVGMVGQCICLFKKGDDRFVLFPPLRRNPSNTYLMAGVYVFGAGTLFATALHIQTYIHASSLIHSCPTDKNWNIPADFLVKDGSLSSNTTASPLQILFFGGFCISEVCYNTVRLFFTGLQLIFLQTFRTAVFKNSGWVKFVLYHTLMTNFCVWVKYILDESRLFDHKEKYFSNIDVFITTSLSLAEIMTPFTLEYSLLTAGILYTISSQIGNDQAAPPLQPVPDIYIDDQRAQNVRHPKGSQPGFILGLFCGLILVSTAVNFGVSESKRSQRSRNMFLSLECLLSITQLVAIFFLLKILQRHTRRDHELTSDDFLLILSFVLGIFTFDFMALYGTAMSIHDEDKHRSHFVSNQTSQYKLSLNDKRISDVLTVVQFIPLFLSQFMQTVAICLCQRYVPRAINPELRKSAGKFRQLTLFLLTTNLSFWVLDSFIEIRNHAQASYPRGQEYFSDSWDTFVAITYPFAIFYRFHAASMLFELWIRFKFN